MNALFKLAYIQKTKNKNKQEVYLSKVIHCIRDTIEVRSFLWRLVFSIMILSHVQGKTLAPACPPMAGKVLNIPARLAGTFFYQSQRDHR